MNEVFRSKTSKIPDMFNQLNTSELFAVKAAAEHKSKAGIYVFYENGLPVHVGRTRNLQGRLRGHIANSHYSASFAFKLARRSQNKIATYTTKGSRADLMKDEDFSKDFRRQIERIKTMGVRFIRVTDHVEQYLLELYACLEYGLPLDEFDTH